MNKSERFFRRYIFSIVSIIILFLFVNILLVASFFAAAYLGNVKNSNFPIEDFSNHITETNGQFNADIQAEDMLNNACAYENSDLCVILGNLLDNAIEAAENSENKEIDVRIVYAKNKLKITVKNYYTGKIKKDTGGNFISTKSDTKNHGIGLQSVTRIVEAYGGVMEVLTERSVFQVNILM